MRRLIAPTFHGVDIEVIDALLFVVFFVISFESNPPLEISLSDLK